MSPTPIASVTFAPQPPSSLARNASSPPPGSPATSTRSTLEPREVDAALLCDLDEVGRVGGSEHRGFGPQALDRRSSRSVLPVPKGMWQSPMRSKAASAAPAANGPALYVVTIRWPAEMPDAA